MRLLSWDAALGLFSEKPFSGYGAGNIQDELDDYYERKDYKKPLKDRHNAHNVFLQIALENGITGLLILLLIFILIFNKGMQRPVTVFTMLVGLIFLINGLFESWMNRFSGLAFFSFMVCFILTSDNPRRTEK